MGAPSRWGSVYAVPADAAGEAAVYGEFGGCRILGHECSIVVERAGVDADQAPDILGRPNVWALGGHAIHISGLDTFGQRTGPGFVRALGRYRVQWASEPASPHDRPSGLGCREPEWAAIVSWDGDATGRGHRDDRWQHIAHWGCVRGFLTGEGLRREWVAQGRPTFRAGDVLEWIDARRDMRRSMALAGDRQHSSAVRRLCETMVGVSNHPWPWVLRRSGRWAYTFDDGGV